MADTPSGETAPVEPVTNDAPTVTSTNDTELAELRRKAEQAEMRARQLENEKAAREAKDAEATRQKLEEENEFRTLYEREKAERERLEQEREQATVSATLSQSKATIFAEYPAEVIDIAETAGLGLYEDTDQAKADLKAKLDAIKGKLGVVDQKPTVQGNNRQPTPAPENGTDYFEQMRFNSGEGQKIAEQARRRAINEIPALNEMRKNAGLKVE